MPIIIHFGVCGLAWGGYCTCHTIYTKLGECMALRGEPSRADAYARTIRARDEDTSGPLLCRLVHDCGDDLVGLGLERPSHL